MEIRYRDVTEDDFRKLRALIGRQFRKDDDGCDETANAFLDYMLMSYLSRSNYLRAAVDGDDIVGFLAGRCEKQDCPSLKLDYGQITNDDLAAISKSGKWKNKVRYQDRIANTSKEMLKDHKCEFDGELVAFFMDPDRRGEGIGQKLLIDFRNHMIENDAGDFYLFTEYFDEKYYSDTQIRLVEKRKMIGARIFHDNLYLCRYFVKTVH